MTAYCEVLSINLFSDKELTKYFSGDSIVTPGSDNLAHVSTKTLGLSSIIYFKATTTVGLVSSSKAVKRIVCGAETITQKTDTSIYTYTLWINEKKVIADPSTSFLD